MNSINRLPVMNKLDIPPSLEEVLKTIESLACNKAPWKDGMPPEVIKIRKNNPLVNYLHELLCQCWDEGTFHQDMCDANIATLYKIKCDRSDCNNYCGFSFLSIVGKAFTCVVLKRLLSLSDHIYSESQCWFRADRSDRADRSTVDIFTSTTPPKNTENRDNH